MDIETNKPEGFVQLLPLIPLHRAVIFPTTNATFEINDTGNAAVFDTILKEGKEVFLGTHFEEIGKIPGFSDFNKIGVVAHIKNLLTLPNGNLRISVESLRRVRFLSLSVVKGIPTAEVQEIPAPKKADLRSRASRSLLLDLFRAFAASTNHFPLEAIEYLLTGEDTDHLCDIVASHTLDNLSDQLTILNQENLTERVETLCVMVSNLAEQNALKAELERKVHEAMDKNQKEYFLREQMKVIKEELNEGDLSDVDVLREKLSAIEFEPGIREKLERELKRLENMTPGSPDIPVSHAWLETIADLPWHNYTEENYDVDHAREILERDHYGLKKVKERILEFLAVHALTKSQKGTILCLVGPPGVGKTSIAKSVAEALNRNFVRMSLGGVRDEAEIRGHRRTYIGAIPGRIVTSVKQSGTMNPLLLLDEIDKMSQDLRGDPSAALLEVLDAEQNNTFRDHYLDIPFDLSKVMFFITANSLENVSRPLLDRMEIIELGSYTSAEKLEIAKRHLIPKQIKEHGLTKSFFKIDDNAIKTIIEDYTAESGVRTLERRIGALCRKAAMAKAEGRKSFTVSAKRLDELLGHEKAIHDKVKDEKLVGCVTGLAYTAVGGDTLTIEATTMPGDGKVQLTGSLGDVMKESASAALTYIRAHAKDLSLDPDFYKTIDLHIHVPMGATPKDGPSAGVTMVTAIYSAVSGKGVPQTIAMTGETSLRGRVLPIGGLKEKSMAAYRAGVKTVLYPADNTPDLQDVPEIVRDNLNFIPMNTLSDVLSHVFTD